MRFRLYDSQTNVLAEQGDAFLHFDSVSLKKGLECGGSAKKVVKNKSAQPPLMFPSFSKTNSFG